MRGGCSAGGYEGKLFSMWVGGRLFSRWVGWEAVQQVDRIGGY